MTPIGNRDPARFLLTNMVFCLLLALLAAEGQAPAGQQGAKPGEQNAGRSATSSLSWEERQKLLTLEDLEKVTGLSGLKPGEKNHARDKMLVFSKQEKFGNTPAHFMVLSVSFVVMEGYWEAQTKLGKVPTARVPVSGVGDEAFEETRDCALYFHKGKVTVFMMGGPSLFTSKCYLTTEQMRGLATIITGRL